jgi:hypothetical protein
MRKMIATVLLAGTALIAGAQNVDKQLNDVKVPADIGQNTLLIVSPFHSDVKKHQKFEEAIAAYKGQKIVAIAFKAMPKPDEVEKYRQYRYVLQLVEDYNAMGGSNPSNTHYMARDWVITLTDRQDPKFIALNNKIEAAKKSGNTDALLKLASTMDEKELPQPVFKVTVDRKWEEALQKVVVRLNGSIN